MQNFNEAQLRDAIKTRLVNGTMTQDQARQAVEAYKAQSVQGQQVNQVEPVAQQPQQNSSIGSITGRDYSKAQRGFNADYVIQQLKSEAEPLADEGQTGFLGKFGSLFSGKDRKTATTEALEKQWDDYGFFELQNEINDFMGGKANAARYEAETLTMFDPFEQAKVAMKLNPDLDMRVEQDAQGNDYPILINSNTGQATLLNDLGLDARDIAKGVGTGLLFLRGKKAKGGLGKRMADEAGSAAIRQGLIEGQHAWSGGDFDPLDVVAAGFGGALGEAVTPAAKAGFQGSKEALSKAKNLIGRFGRSSDDIVVDSATQISRAPEEIIQIRAQEEAKGFVTDETGDLIGTRQEQIDNALRKGDEQRLARMIDADPQYFADLENVGITDGGIPTRASQSPQMVQTGETFTKMTGSDAYERAVNEHIKLQDSANDILNRFGASDKGITDFDLFEQGQKAIDGIKSKEANLYNEIRKEITKNPASKNIDNIQSTDSIIQNKISESARGEASLNKLEKEILTYIDEGLSYSDLDRLRKKVGAAAFEGRDIYPDATDRELAQLYQSLSEDQERIASEFGLKDIWENAKQLTQQRKGLEDKSKELFGRKLDNTGITSRLAKSINNLSSGDAKGFNSIMKSLPTGKGSQELRQSVIMTALKDVVKGGSTKAEGFSIGNFSNWYNKLNASPAYKSALYKELPKEFRGQLDSLGRISTKLNRAIKSTPPTGMNLTSTAYINKLQNSAKGFLSRWTNAVTGGLVNIGDTITESEAKKLAMDKAAGVLNNPNFLNLVKAASQGKERAVELAEKRLMKTKAVKDLAETLDDSQKKALVNQGFVRWLESQYGEEMEQAEDTLIEATK